MRVVRRGRSLGFAPVLMLIAMSSVVIAPTALASEPRCFGRKATHVGTQGDNEIKGSPRTDVIVARGGVDIIRAGRGRDFICAGGGGFDAIFAGRGNDKARGQGGDDVVFPGPGTDFVNGGAGGNFVTYEGSSTPIVADLAEGTINSGERVDEIKNVAGVGGSEASDVLVGDRGANPLYGNGGDDELTGRGGEDFLSTGAGDDRAAGGRGFDLLDLLTAFGGPGLDDDTYASSGAVADLDAGTVVGGSDVGTDTIFGMEAVGGTLGNDVLAGDEQANTLVSFGGDDELTGADGDDSLEPGAGNDTLDGGKGSDLADYFSAGPVDGQLGPITIDLADQSATGPDLGTDALMSIERGGGTTFDDTLLGSPGPDFLIGDDGGDTIRGGKGDDYLDGDAYYFGAFENFSRPDALHGGRGADTCLGAESTESCEMTDPPRDIRTGSQTPAFKARY